MKLSNSFDYDTLKNHIKKNEKKFLDYRHKTADNVILEEDLECNNLSGSNSYFRWKTRFDSGKPKSSDSEYQGI